MVKSIGKAMVEAMHQKPFHEAKGESPVHQAGNLLLGQNCIKMDSPWGSNFLTQWTDSIERVAWWIR